MSTLTHLESSHQTAAAAPRKRMISGPLALVFMSEFALLTSFYLLLSVTPLYAARAGAGSAGAGLVTGAGGTAAIGLLAQALTATAARWWEGRHGDRHGHARLLIPGLVATSFGMTTMVWLATPATVIAGMCLFGAGFGIVQNATLALMIDRMPASGLGTASALWNLAYDAGYGAGPVLFGLFVGHTGYPAAFALTGLLVLAALPACRREQARRR
jgi:MFS family permease